MILIPRQLSDAMRAEAVKREIQSPYAGYTEYHVVAGCPWCGSPCQYTDPWGTCVKCKLPWDVSNWDTRHFDEAEMKLRV